MRTEEQKILNLSGYENYRETLIDSCETKIALSIYEAKKSDPCIVFLPGTMSSPILYDEFLGGIASSGFNVIGVHLISHGKSPREKELYTIDDMVKNTRDAVGFCIEGFNDNVAIMGSSQGGLLATLVAATEERIKAVFVQNLIVPRLKESITITRFPNWLKPVMPLVTKSVWLGSKIFPGFKMPIEGYLDFDRITLDKEIKHRFYTDPEGLTSYPLHFMSSLFNADTDGLFDGSIKCPAVVIASEGDKLFSRDYQSHVYEMLVAPKKEIMWFDEDSHLIMVEDECVKRITRRIVDKLAEYLK